MFDTVKPTAMTFRQPETTTSIAAEVYDWNHSS
jgi:hypothetical protein